MEVRSLLRTIRNDLHSAHRSYVFRRAIKEFLLDPCSHTSPQDPLLGELIHGWDNEDWSATSEYLAACLTHAMTTKGPILECGSGLTTIIVGILADSLGKNLWSLEHDLGWAQRVNEQLIEHEIHSVCLTACPLKVFDGYSWYDAPLESMPQFSMVICDGPPAGISGGRYGLLPIMRSKLEPGTIILLDDAERVGEQTIAGRWAAELNTTFGVADADKPYIRLVIP